MQLNGKSSIRGTLTAFTVALLGSGSVHAGSGKSMESSLLLYSESDRVQAGEGIVSLKLPVKGNRLLNARLTLDGLTGASPNGATPSNRIQTFTKPSGNGAYTVNPGDMPLDNTFKDVRFSLNASLDQPLDRLTTLVIGTNVSVEQDYQSYGANVGFSRDFNHRNTTLSASAALTHDISAPLGGPPVPLTTMAPLGDDDEGENEGEDDDEREGESGKSKNIYDAVFSVTQVLNRKTLLRLNYSYNHSSGYLNDPYKLVSVVQNSQGSEPGEPVEYLYESRPGTRTKQAVFGEIKRFIGGHTIDLSYRYFWDDWGITSHTVDVRYRLPIKPGHALTPHVRWYRQAEADFFQSYLLDNNPLPDFASADYRLGPFHAVTLGLQYSFPVAPGMHFSFGGEYYRQVGDLSPPESRGILSSTELFPNLDAIMVRAGFSYDF